MRSHTNYKNIASKPRFRAVPGTQGQILYAIHTGVNISYIYTSIQQLYIMKQYGGWFGGSLRNAIKWSLAYQIVTGPNQRRLHFNSSNRRLLTFRQRCYMTFHADKLWRARNG